jgi:phosphonopyruvate decarboxylase
MLHCHEFFSALRNEGVGFFAGVPDSLLKNICAYISDHAPRSDHVIAANEGAALALASGHYLATGRPGLVYLQNSGLGNLVNPLTSLTDPEVYAIPAILLIGWRGEPGVHDEPQHRMQGRVMLATLGALEIEHAVLPDDAAGARIILARAMEITKASRRPFALIVRKGTFEAYKLKNKAADLYTIRREDALKLALDSLVADEVVVSTTGMTSREVFEHREATGAGHARDFLTVGCMGHASQIAMGVAIAKPARLVYCLDGDGAVLMHLGSLAVIGASGQANFRHLVVNNGAHDSVGGQPTVGFTTDLPAVARACGYRWVCAVSSPADIPGALAEFKSADGPAFLEIRVNKGSRSDLGRPTTTTHDNKRDFMAYLQ